MINVAKNLDGFLASVMLRYLFLANKFFPNLFQLKNEKDRTIKSE